MVEVPVVVEASLDPGDIDIQEVDEDPPARLAAFRDGEVV